MKLTTATATAALLTVLSLHLATSEDVFQPGPHSVQHSLYYSLFNLGLSHNVDVYAPDAPGEFPVVYFVPGMTGIFPANAYRDFLGRISSHGFVVVGIWTLTELPPWQIKGEWLKKVDIWLQEHLSEKMLGDGFNPEMLVDFSKIFLMSQSSGAHVLVNYLKSDFGCDNVNGLILISPVDGLDPYGIMDEFCIVPGEKLDFETPTLVMSVGYDNVPGISGTGGLVPACAPDKMSNLRFWDALNGEAWYINATEYGHLELLIEGLCDDIVDMLHFCSPGTEPIPAYQDFSAGEVVSFMKGVLGSCDHIKYLEDASLMTIRVETRRQHGSEPICQRGGYCKHL